MGKKYTADTFEGAVTGTASGNVAKSGDTMTGALTNTSGDVKTVIGGSDMLSFEADSGAVNNKIKVLRNGGTDSQAYIGFEEVDAAYTSNKMIFNLATPGTYTENDFLTLQDSNFSSSDIFIRAHKKIIADDGIYLGTTSQYSSANHLDDYEDGTYNPAFYLGSNSTAFTSSDFTNFTNYSKYLKVGRKVTLYVNFTYSDIPSAIESSTSIVGLGSFPFTPARTEYCGGTYDFNFYERPNSSTIPQEYGWNGILNPAFFGNTFSAKVKLKKMIYISPISGWTSNGILGNEFPRSGPFSSSNYFSAVIHYYTND